MTDDQIDGGEARDPLDLERADFGADDGQGLKCETCLQPISDFYYHVGGKTLCNRCQPKVAAELSASPRFWRAAGFGLLAAAAGAGIWYAVLALTGYEVGLIAVVVGLMVGAAVRAGSGNRGGTSVQLLAVFLTYTAIVSSYAPFLFGQLDEMEEPEVGPMTTTPDSALPSIRGLPDESDATAVPPEGIPEAREFLAALGNALAVWTEDVDDEASKTLALDSLFGTLEDLLEANPNPLFLIMPDDVIYSGLAMSGLGEWSWRERLANAGIARIEFDRDANREGLRDFLDEAAGMLAFDELPGGLVTGFGIAFVVVLLYLSPLLAGVDNIIGLLIIGFALWEAWRMNTRQKIEITGPFHVTRPNPAEG